LIYFCSCLAFSGSICIFVTYFK